MSWDFKACYLVGKSAGNIWEISGGKDFGELCKSSLGVNSPTPVLFLVCERRAHLHKGKSACYFLASLLKVSHRQANPMETVPF